MTKYEVVFILNTRKIDPSSGHDSKIEKVIESCSAKLIEKKDLGRKKFARPIGKKKTGSYWSYVLEMNEDIVSEFQEKFLLDEVVIRLIVFKYDIPENPKTLELVKQ